LIAQSRESFPAPLRHPPAGSFPFSSCLKRQKGHLPLDYRDISLSQADLIAVIDDGSLTDSRSVDQFPKRHIGSGPDGGVAVTRGVATERTDPAYTPPPLFKVKNDYFD
jgi:hypothetical protein